MANLCHARNGQASSYLTPHPLYLAIGRGDIRLALNQNQTLGSSRFYARIEAMTGQRRQAKPRGRHSIQRDDFNAPEVEQVKLGLWRILRDPGRGMADQGRFRAGV